MSGNFTENPVLDTKISVHLLRFTLTALLCLCSLVFSLSARASEDTLQPLLQRLAAEGSLQIAGATIYQLPVTQQLYERNSYLPAWTRQQTISELSTAIRQAWREGMSPPDYHQTQVQGLLDGTLDLGVSARDLLLTDSLVRLTYHYALGKVVPQDHVATWNFERALPRVDPVAWLGEVIGDGGITSGLDRLKPGQPGYQLLVAALARYRDIAASGGWEPVTEGATLRPGDSGPRVAQLRLRLLAEGDLREAESADPHYFDPDLERAVMRFQRRHRLDVDGIVGRQTLAALNVPVEQRIGQIRVNLERSRVLQDIPSTALLVDIAGFEVSLLRNNQRLFLGRAQVGRPYRSTPVFHDLITYIEFNPTWTVPPSILKKDVLPAIKSDPDYLNKRNMQVLTMAGEVVDPGSVDWQLYPQTGFPYMIRQQPGPDNALGRVKIMFPNEHFIYLHDTPSRELFNRSERTFSSGCIRVEDIEQLVELLLDDPERWNRAAIDRAIDSRQSRRVSLRTPFPVYLVYWTIQVQPDGEVHFKLDPYKRDAIMLEALEKPLVPDAGRLSGAISLRP